MKRAIAKKIVSDGQTHDPMELDKVDYYVRDGWNQAEADELLETINGLAGGQAQGDIDVIGKGGATIRAITEETGATIEVDDDGVIKIASVEKAAGDEARRRVEQVTAGVEVGIIYEGKVAKIMDFGAFVNILPGKDGLVHISQISDERVENVSDKLSEGDVVKVKVLEVDRQGRIRLSMKAVSEDEAANA